MGFDFLIYDLDGTLVDSLGDIASSVNSVREDNGLEHLSLKQIRSYLGSGINALISKAIPDKCEKFKQNVDGFKSYYKRRILDTTIMFSGVKEMLESLKDKKKAILTNKNEGYAKEIVEKLEIADYFVEVWGGDTLDVRKPDPKTILELVKTTKSKLSKTVMIGDSTNDFLVAKAAGVQIIAVAYGYCDLDQIKAYRPDYIVKTPQEIANIVL
ncbi:MAG: HAD-IA family hydrolase [Endomicrobium sp.]|jgi:phosphoglycolate phosphatase|nr:HAD-IA family hydrolase [Endomicrobium sp.]MDR2427904.1 HAD-IA family hydrolase [Endomicrobium sp.]MDR2818410.1 HAD-IA family hydrolase [Endomicrobium sp.]